MELNELKALVKVVQAGSFTRAAEVLGTQKAQLSRVISGLEARLGVRLLERTTRSLSLTEAGRELYARAEGILAAVEDAECLAQQLQGEPRGQLKLTSGVELGMLMVSGWIRRYLLRFPEMKVEADFTGRLVELVHEGFDLAIRVGPLQDSNLAARRLGVLHYGLFTAPQLLAERGTPRHPEALKGWERVAFTGGRHRRSWELYSGTESVQLEPDGMRLQVNNSFAVRDALVEGLGVGILPLLVAAPLVGSGQLVRVLPAWAPVPVPVHALFPSVKYLTPKVRCFIDLAVEAFREAHSTLMAQGLGEGLTASAQPQME